MKINTQVLSANVLVQNSTAQSSFSLDRNFSSIRIRKWQWSGGGKSERDKKKKKNQQSDVDVWAWLQLTWLLKAGMLVSLSPLSSDQSMVEQTPLDINKLLFHPRINMYISKDQQVKALTFLGNYKQWKTRDSNMSVWVIFLVPPCIISWTYPVAVKQGQLWLYWLDHILCTCQWQTVRGGRWGTKEKTWKEKKKLK